jgi:hypothetical protein
MVNQILKMSPIHFAGCGFKKSYLWMGTNQKKYPGQQIIIIEINEYVYLVPFVESSEGKFLKTIIPSRKATRDYLGGKNEQDKT